MSITNKNATVMEVIIRPFFKSFLIKYHDEKSTVFVKKDVQCRPVENDKIILTEAEFGTLVEYLKNNDISEEAIKEFSNIKKYTFFNPLTKQKECGYEGVVISVWIGITGNVEIYVKFI